MRTRNDVGTSGQNLDPLAGRGGQRAQHRQQAAPFDENLPVPQIERPVQRGAVTDGGQHRARETWRPYGHRLVVPVLMASAPRSSTALRCSGSVTKPPTMIGSGTRARIRSTTNGKITPGSTSTTSGRAWSSAASSYASARSS